MRMEISLFLWKIFFELLLSLQNLSCVLLWGLEYVSWGVATHIPRFFFHIKCLTLEFWCYLYVSILNNLRDCQCIIIKCTIAQNVLIFLVWFLILKKLCSNVLFCNWQYVGQTTTWTTGLNFYAWKCYDLVNCLQLGCKKNYS